MTSRSPHRTAGNTHFPGVIDYGKRSECVIVACNKYPRAQTLSDLKWAVDDADLARTTLEPVKIAVAEHTLLW